MKARYFSILIIAVMSLIPFRASCCTSVIISGKARYDGRPVMIKHRDTDELNNRIQWLQGEKYSLLGLVNSPDEEGDEVWSGANSAGFCIMNTAAYNLKFDDVPDSQMNCEGLVMHGALEVCATLKDFEYYLDTLTRPIGVQTNFGVIDAFGGAAYYEVDNTSWVKYDVAEEPGGYMVVTNFTRRGDPNRKAGVDRFHKANEIMSGMDVSHATHKELFNMISRSGVPISRYSTSASVAFEGVKPGEDPSKTVMWSLVGSPCTGIYFPLMVSDKDNVPFFLKNSAESQNCAVCDLSLLLKKEYGYAEGVSDACRKVEEYIDSRFSPEMSQSSYLKFSEKAYRKYCKMAIDKLKKHFRIAEYDKND